MKDPNEVAQAYIAPWNEAGRAERAALIEQAWAPDGTYRDPMMQGEGAENINAMIGAAQAQFPGLKFRLNGEAQAVGECVRLSWHLAPEANPEAPIAGGTDFCVLDSRGRLQSVTGFIDFFHGAPS